MNLQGSVLLEVLGAALTSAATIVVASSVCNKPKKVTRDRSKSKSKHSDSATARGSSSSTSRHDTPTKENPTQVLSVMPVMPKDPEKPAGEKPEKPVGEKSSLAKEETTKKNLELVTCEDQLVLSVVQPAPIDMSQLPREVLDRLRKTQVEKDDDEKGLLSLVKTQDISKSMEPGGKVTTPRQAPQKSVPAPAAAKASGPPSKRKIQYKPTTYVTVLAGAAGPKILQEAPLAAALPEAKAKQSEPAVPRPTPAVEQKTPPTKPQTTAAVSQKSMKGLPIGASVPAGIQKDSKPGASGAVQPQKPIGLGPVQPQKAIGPIPVTKITAPYQSPIVSQAARDASVKVAKPAPAAAAGAPAPQVKAPIQPTVPPKPTTSQPPFASKPIGQSSQANKPPVPPPKPVVPQQQPKKPSTPPPKPALPLVSQYAAVQSTGAKPSPTGGTLK